MLELLHESNDFFVLKELEKLAPKQKGIGTLSHLLLYSCWTGCRLTEVARGMSLVVAQSVKDVLTELHDDHLIEIEKVRPIF